jgi:hypothetical protein
MTTTTYRRTDAPRHAAMYAFDCADCGHEELTRPVFLAAEAGTVRAYGSGCAARLLGVDVTALELDEALDALPRTPWAEGVFADFLVMGPKRITPKFRALVADRCGAPRADVDAAVDAAERAFRALGAARRAGTVTGRGVRRDDGRWVAA